MGAQGSVRVYLEVSSRRTFAAALDWPGWARSGRDPQAALATLAEYGARYARAVRPARLGFAAPGDASSFVIVERLKGDATTDFGAPGAIPRSMASPLWGRMSSGRWRCCAPPGQPWMAPWRPHVARC